VSTEVACWLELSQRPLLQLGGTSLSMARIAGLLAIGVGIGFGLQTIFSNLISGVILLLEKTLKHGDSVDLASGVRGTVTEIGTR
jgi:small-conductance mechanosensitive channel